MSFFEEDEKAENLQYDDTAFMHFSIAICAVSAVVLICVIWSEAHAKRFRVGRQIKGMPIFREKIENEMKNYQSYWATRAFCWKLVGLILCAAALGVCYSRVDSEQMIGFDPHEILGVPIDAPVNVIKKAYRKLALEYHPDRNQHNPKAAAKFIQISKAYQCLTDEKKKELCLKYGNPDGQSSYKVGIGLPAFMVETGNQTFVLPIIFFVLLVLVPKYFFSWSRRVEPSVEGERIFSNYQSFYKFMTPNFKLLCCPIMLGTMAELDPYFPEQETLKPPQQTGFKNMLNQIGILNPEQVNEIPPHILFRCYKVYFYMTANKKVGSAERLFPELCQQMIMFALNFSRKTGSQQHLAGQPKWPISWLGVAPIRSIAFFIRQMYFPGVRFGQISSIEFLDLNEEQMQIAAKNPIGSSLTEFVHSEPRIDEFVAKFPEASRAYIKSQILCLPAISVQTRVLIGEEEVEQMTVNDVANFEITLRKRRSTPGYVMSKAHAYLTQQIFYVMLTYNDNLMFFSPTVFHEGSDNQLIFNVKHSQGIERQMKFKLEVFAPYDKMDIVTQFMLNVTADARNQMDHPVIHEEDRNLERIPRTFWESIASLETATPSDCQLSDGSDSDADEHRPHFQEQAG